MPTARPTFGDSLSKTINRARHRGPAEALGDLSERIRSRLGTQSGVLQILERPTDGTLQHLSDASFRKATASDAPAYARDIATDSPRTFRRRLSPETGCYLVESRGRILHASWVTSGSAWTAELDAFVTPPEGDAYIYESFTRPETRGRGIYPFALHNICADLGQSSVPRAWIAVEATNAPSVRAISKAGFELAFELRFRRERGKVQVEAAIGPRSGLADGFVTEAPRG